MCDNHSEEESAAQLKIGKLNRRQFAQLGITAAMAMLLPPLANAQAVSETDVNIQTADGVADCYWVHPSSGKHPAVVIWPDILGLRPAPRAMGKRLAQSGYSVLVIHPFYRSAKSPVVPDGAIFADPKIASIVRPMAGQLNASTHLSDARALIAWLDQQAAVDTGRKMATAGYCMGGPMAMRMLANFPERVAAGASFHGAGLNTNNPDSPHLSVANIKGRMLIAIAADDDARAPVSKEILRTAFAAANVPAEIEVYAGANHGWTVPDFPSYQQAAAERAWTRMLNTFERALT